MGLTKAAITRPIFVFMLVAAAFLLGIISYRSMRLELNPDVTFPIVTITTQYPGAGPEEINELVSRKVEEAISGVNGLRELTSSSYEGVSSVVAQFELGTNADVAMNDVRSKVDAAVNSLPKDALKPSVSKLDISSQAVLTLAFSSTGLNSQQLRDLLDQKLADQFAQIPGVASVGVQGGDVREIQVQLKKDRLLAYGIGISQVQQQISSASINAPAGRLVNGDTEYSVRMPAQFETADQVRNMLLTISDPNQAGSKPKIVRLSDVADVSDTVQERTQYSRLNGRDTIVLAIQKSRDGNAVDITDAADKLIAQIEKDYKADGVNIVKTYEAATQIKDSLRDVNFDLTFAIVLVAAIVFVFLHNLRGTIIVALAIPTSIFATFCAMNLFGFTINNITMLAMTLAVGVLVDDAIVVLENIYRHLKMGEDPREAAINGRSEIGLAAIAITMADVVVFGPIAIMGGIVGQFFHPMAIAMVSAVLCSLFISFTLTPMLASRWYRAGEDMEHPTGWFATNFERMFARLEHAYRRTLEWALNHRWFVFCTGNAALFAVFMFIGGSFAPNSGAALKSGMALLMPIMFIAVIAFLVNLFQRRIAWRVLLGAAAFGLIVFPLASLAGFGFAQWKGEAVFKFGFMPESDGNQISVNIELPPGSSLEATQRVVTQIEKKVMAEPDVKYVVSTLGTQSVGGFLGGGNSGSNYAAVSATLYDLASIKDKVLGSNEKLRFRRDTTVVAVLTQKLGHVAGAQVTVSATGGQGFGSPIQMSFSGENRQLLTSTANKIKTLLQDGAVKGVINPDTSSKPGKIELQVNPDRTRVADAGLSVAQAAGSLRTLYQGDDTTKLRVNGKEYTIRVMLNLADRNDPDVLSTVPVSFNQGRPVYLSDLGPIIQKPGVTKIDRRNREDEVRLTADLLPGYAAGSVQLQINQWLADKHLVPEGVVMKPLGQADSQAREQGFLFGAIGMGLVLVYMLLASLYDNLLYPFIIQLSQPQAMTGAILGLIITNKSLNIVGMIGIITLVGLVGKNAILLVDYTNTLRGRGRNRHDALVEAGPTRLRPILMTTMALILGTLPIALALGRGSEFRETLGITIIGGISLSTVLTLVVIPCSYTIFDDLSNAISRMRGKRPDPTGAEPLTQDDTESKAKPSAPIEA